MPEITCKHMYMYTFYKIYSPIKFTAKIANFRLNCSSLNEHLFNKNLVASNRCVCGQVESTTHYLFHCIMYQNVRTRTINTLPRVNTNILLYGNNQLSLEENEHIFDTVHTFIADSGRFGL